MYNIIQQTLLLCSFSVHQLQQSLGNAGLKALEQVPCRYCSSCPASPAGPPQAHLLTPMGFFPLLYIILDEATHCLRLQKA